LTETIVADGTEKPLSEPECRGWQRAEWSTLGARLFARAEITCTGQTPRKVSELSLMISGPTWIDIQLVETDGRKNLRVRRYRRAADQRHAGSLPPPARGTAAIPLSPRLSIAEVKEAAIKVEPETLQAALVELGRGFDLNGKELIELDKAGVPDSVTDLMVALTFPQRLVIERSTRSGGYSSGWSGGFDELWPYFTHPYFYTSYYAPFGYRYWGHYDSYYFGGPGFVTVNPGETTPTAQPSGEGRVVDGLGYTRVRRNEPVPSSSGRARDGSGGSSTASTSGSSGSSNSGSSSGGSSGVSSSGYSGGGGDGGRTAQPRPPGNR
jgi:hypothetical protein